VRKLAQKRFMRLAAGGNHENLVGVNLLSVFVSYTVSLLYSILLITLKRPNLQKESVNLLKNVL
jgi:hypothetical protein